MHFSSVLAIPLIALILVGCIRAQQPTRQAVEKIAMLNSGMSKENVSRIMGLPARTEFAGQKEAWHFCRTGEGSDEFAVVIFSEGKVVAAKNYNVSIAQNGGALGDCSKFVRSVLQADKLE
ncbi:hypothetical protein [Methylomonas sp. Kb3]|uniref:hypothetical protein n=1 Tax=Methylomonas sp. Kb3 TaxID=1611544 RepID=UPI00197B336F|nr:hypothetical protein [Methylomonas sp. Kb3]